MIECVVGWGWWVLPAVNTHPAHRITIGRARDGGAATEVRLFVCFFIVCMCLWFACGLAGAGGVVRPRMAAVDVVAVLGRVTFFF